MFYSPQNNYLITLCRGDPGQLTALGWGLHVARSAGVLLSCFKSCLPQLDAAEERYKEVVPV